MANLRCNISEAISLHSERALNLSSSATSARVPQRLDLLAGCGVDTPASMFECGLHILLRAYREFHSFLPYL